SFFIYGIMLAFTSGSDDALIYDDLKARGKKELAQKYYGYYRGAGVLSLGVAGLIGGFMSVSHTLESFWLSYLATFIAQIVGFLLLFTVREPKRSNEGENIKHKPERVLNLFKDGLKLIRNSPSLKRITIFSMLVAPFSFILASIIQPYYELVGVPNSWWGVAIFAGSVLTFFAKTNAYRIESWFGVDKGMIIVTILPAITYALMSVVFNPILAVVLYVLTDAFGNLRDPIITDYKNQHIKSYNRATVLSTIYIISGVYAVLIRPVIGNLTDYSVSLAFGVIAAIFIFSLIFFPIKKEHVRFANDLK
ncbi:MAG: MFS-type transporter, partial [candidate division CPR2 bacterium GW2011_GWD1_39_7]